MLNKIKNAIPFVKKDGRGTITNILSSFSDTIKTLEDATTLNNKKADEHTEEITKRTADIEDLQKHNEIAEKLKKNLSNLIS